MLTDMAIIFIVWGLCKALSLQQLLCHLKRRNFDPLKVVRYSRGFKEITSYKC